MSVTFSDDFEDGIRRVGRQAAQGKWDDFCGRMAGKSEDEIRAAIAQEWDGTITDEGVRAIAAGKHIDLKINFKS